MSKQKRSESNLFRDIFSYGITGMLRYFVPFLLLPFYTHFLDQNEFASLDLIISATVIVSICVLEFNNGYARYYYQHGTEGDQGDFYQTMFYAFLVGGGILTVLFIPLGYYLGPILCPGMPQAGLIVVIMVAALFPQIIMEYSLVNARLLHRKIFFGILVLADSVIKGLLAIFFIAVLGMGVMGYGLSVLISYTGMAIGGTLYCRKIFPGKVRPELLKKVARYVLPLLPGNIFGYLNEYGGRFIMLAYLDLHQIAIYALAIRLARVAKMCLGAFNQAWQPVSMEHISTGKTDAIFARILDRYALISLIMVLVGGLASGPLVALIAPPGYADAARLLPILIGATLLSGSSYVLEIGNLAAVKTHWTSMARGLSMITNFGIAFLLVGKFGALAIAMGMLGAAITRAVVSYFTAQSSHRIAYRPISVAMLIVGIPAVTWLMVSWRQVAAMDFSFLK